MGYSVYPGLGSGDRLSKSFMILGVTPNCNNLKAYAILTGFSNVTHSDNQ